MILSDLFSPSDFEVLFEDLCAFASLLDGAEFFTNRQLLVSLAVYLNRSLDLRIDPVVDCDLLVDTMVLVRQVAVGGSDCSDLESHLIGLTFNCYE